jgi:hypothetical protein
VVAAPDEFTIRGPNWMHGRVWHRHLTFAQRLRRYRQREPQRVRDRADDVGCLLLSDTKFLSDAKVFNAT